MLLSILTHVAIAAEEAAPGFTMAEIWEHSGGIARTVIVMLVVMMLASIVVSIERAWMFHKAKEASIALVGSIVEPLQAGDIKASLALCNAEEHSISYIATLLRAGLKELDERCDEHGVANADRALDKSLNEEVGKLKKGMTILATTGSTAPFVGLFGTTFGVINAFQGMATGGGGLAGISAGISEALITTGVGIGVAVIGVWFFNYFNFRIEKITEELESSKVDLIDWAQKLVLAKSGK
jgi:biopolymer transport protein ExbB/TolQ